MRPDIPARITDHVALARWRWIGALLLSLLVCAAAVPAFLEGASPEEESTGPIAVEANPQVFATIVLWWRQASGPIRILPVMI